MKWGLNIRGPRLGTKLALMGLALLVVPWFSYLQLVEMERLLIQGQSQAQLLTAEGISTLFNGREDLFNDLPVTWRTLNHFMLSRWRTPFDLMAVRRIGVRPGTATICPSAHQPERRTLILICCWVSALTICMPICASKTIVWCIETPSICA